MASSLLLRLALTVLATLAAFLSWSTAGAQTDALPGVRGALYESPDFGWILLVPEPDWTVADASFDGVYDWVRLYSDMGDGVEDLFVSYLADGRGVTGCTQDLVDILAAAYEGYPVQGWREPEVEFSESDTDNQALAYARVVRSQDPGLDILAFIDCRQEAGSSLIIGEALLRTERGLEQEGPVMLTPLWPGDLHTGRARGGGAPDGFSAPGVVIFRAGYWEGAGTDSHFPIHCVHEEPYVPPAEPPPAGLGYFPCAGQIINVDVVPSTVDLANLVLGCERVPAGDSLPPGCTGELVAPAAFEVLQAPPGEAGPVFTLAPGELVEVVLWYTLPEGDVPLDIYYLEPDREDLVLAGTTFFTQGSGSRPKVRLGR